MATELDKLLDFNQPLDVPLLDQVRCVWLLLHLARLSRDL
jgi:hypothetical protein